MLIPTVAQNYIAQRIATSATPFDNGNAWLGVGDSDTALSAEQTDLQGTNKIRKPMDIGYPQVTDNAVTFQATFDVGEAEWEWKEWAVFNAETGGTMLCRVVENNSTKIAQQTWVLQATVQFVSS